MISEDNHKVSIIVVNWNGERFLKDCLGALSNQSYVNCEIVLVDNGSSDDSVRFARENFPEVKIVGLSENKGFTGGNAAGLEVAKGAYIALVNNDARFVCCLSSRSKVTSRWHRNNDDRRGPDRSLLRLN